MASKRDKDAFALGFFRSSIDSASRDGESQRTGTSNLTKCYTKVQSPNKSLHNKDQSNKSLKGGPNVALRAVTAP
jgi:hypothetical protein